MITTFIKRFLVVIVILLISLPAAGAFKYLTVGMDSPKIESEGLDYDSLIKGKTLLVVFWASWSKRSLEQLDDLQEIYSSYKDSNLVIIAINVEKEVLTSVEKDSIKSLYASRGYTFPLVIDEGLKIFYTYGVIAVPSTALVDSTGTLRYAPAGYSLGTRDKLFDSIMVLLGKKEAHEMPELLTQGYRPDKRALRYYYLGLNLYNKGLFKQALDNLHKSASLDTLFSTPLGLIGNIWMDNNDCDSALVYLQEAVRLDSMNVSALAGLGECLWQKGDTAGTKDLLNHSIPLDSAFTPLRLLQVKTLVADNMLTEALAVLDECLDYHQNNPQIHYMKGTILRLQGQFELASNSFLKAYKLLTK